MNIRIEKIAEMVNKGVIAADIGTDHAFLPILLIERNIASKVYACDINEGPLNAARRNIEKHQMSDRIETILGSGFDMVPEDADCAVIAGMGFHTCASILENAKERLGCLKQIIVEVNRNTEDMRRWISRNRYTVDNEVLISDRGFDYVAISFHTADHEPYSESELICGTEYLRSCEGYDGYCQRNIARISKILKAVKKEDERTERLRCEMDLWIKAQEKTRS